MKIAFFTDGYLPGISGVVTSVHTSVQELRQRGHQVTIVAPTYPKHKDSNQDHIIRLASVPLPGNKQNFRVATYLPGTSLILATQLDVDLIHGHNGGPVSMLGWEVAKIKRIPYVFTYHTMFTQYSHYIFGGKVIKPGAIGRISKVFLNNTDYIIAPSAKIEAELQSFGVSKPVSIIPSGIDLSQFKPTPAGYLHQLFNLPTSKHLLLYLGRVTKEKSVDTVIRAFALTAKKQTTTDLAIIGSGPQVKALQTLAAHLGVADRVHFSGFIDNQQTPHAYSDALALLMTSTTETQGLVVPESLACGTPVITINDPAYTTIVKHKVNGLIAKTNSPQSIAKQINWALDNLTDFQAMSKPAIASVKPISLQNATTNLEQLYQLALNSHSSLNFTQILKSAPRQLKISRDHKPSHNHKSHP